VPAVADLQLVGEAVWCPRSAGRRAVVAGQEGADHFAVGRGELVGVGVHGDGDPREPSGSPEPDPYGRAHACGGTQPDASGSLAGAPPRQPTPECRNRRVARLTSGVPALSVRI
jgi:hypothetical protein